MSSKLYYFTNSFPFGIGEDWKYNELKVLSTHFDRIEIIPFQYDGNYKAKQIDLPNVVKKDPLFRDNSIFVSFTSLWKAFSSTHVIYYCREFFRKAVFLNKQRLIAFLSDAIKSDRLQRHTVIRNLLQSHHKEDVFYFFWGKGSCLFIPLFRKKISARVIVRFHGFDLYEHRNAGYIPFRNQLLQSIDRGLVISKNGLDYITSKYPRFTSKIKLNRLGTIEKGKSMESQDGVFRIFSCSSLIPLKRILLLARSLKLIPFQVLWTHIGDGPQKQDLLEIIKSFPENIRFYSTGWIDPHKVTDYYVEKQCDLFVNVSETEGIPVSIMEAFASSIPAFATNVGGVSEIVNNRNGKLLDPGINEMELSVEIKNFYLLPAAIKASMRQQAYRTFTDYFDALKNAKDLAAICLQ